MALVVCHRVHANEAILMYGVAYSSGRFFPSAGFAGLSWVLPDPDMASGLNDRKQKKIAVSQLASRPSHFSQTSIRVAVHRELPELAAQPGSYAYGYI
jgi:hypothetical protein